MDPRRTLGRQGEDLAARWLEQRGMEVIDRNWRLSSGPLRGELDLIARDGTTLVVVEVKTRRASRFGGAVAAITPEKSRRIRELGAAYVREHRPRARRIRFDVIAIDVQPDGTARLRHVPAAF